MHTGLPRVAEMLKRRGLKVKLDTNGSQPGGRQGARR